MMINDLVQLNGCSGFGRLDRHRIVVVYSHLSAVLSLPLKFLQALLAVLFNYCESDRARYGRSVVVNNSR